MGELLYQRKNRGDATATEPLADAAAAFIRNWPVDLVVPIPPSNTSRKRQPVMEAAREISRKSGVPLCEGCIKKVKTTGQLKDVFDRARRDEILAGADRIKSWSRQAISASTLDSLFAE